MKIHLNMSSVKWPLFCRGGGGAKFGKCRYQNACCWEMQYIPWFMHKWFCCGYIISFSLTHVTNLPVKSGLLDLHWTFIHEAGGLWEFVKSRSHKIPSFTFPITLKFDRHLGSAAANIPVKCQSDTIIINFNLPASRLHRDLKLKLPNS